MVANSQSCGIRNHPMKTTISCSFLILIALIGTGLGGDQPAGKKIGLSFGPWEFERADEHLWLSFHRPTDKGKTLGWLEMHQVQLAGIKTKFVPLVYFKGTDAERKRQQKTNDEIAAFIAEQLEGRKVWIDDAKPAVFAGPRQVLGIVWFDVERKQSLQQRLVEKGLAEEKSADLETD